MRHLTEMVGDNDTLYQVKCVMKRRMVGTEVDQGETVGMGMGVGRGYVDFGLSVTKFYCKFHWKLQVSQQQASLSALPHALPPAAIKCKAHPPTHK